MNRHLCLPPVLGGDAWCNWCLPVWLGWLPWRAAFPARPGGAHRLAVSTSFDSAAGGQLGSSHAASAIWWLARSHASGVLLSGILRTKRPAPQPCGGAAFRFTSKRPAAAASVKREGGALRHALAQCPCCRCSRSPGDHVAPLIGGRCDLRSPTPGPASLSPTEAIGQADYPLSGSSWWCRAGCGCAKKLVVASLL